LAEAEEVATGIFREAGLETRWADSVLTTENDRGNFAGHSTFNLADIQLSVLPREMSDRLGLPNNVMGVVPGADAQIAYVFDSTVEALFQTTLSAYRTGHIDRRVSESQILGIAIAHELGHLLLNLQGHSARGIMRGEWGLFDLRNAADGMLLFTPQQAEVLRANARSRNTQREILKVAEVVFRSSTALPSRQQVRLIQDPKIPSIFPKVPQNCLYPIPKCHCQPTAHLSR